MTKDSKYKNSENNIKDLKEAIIEAMNKYADTGVSLLAGINNDADSKIVQEILEKQLPDIIRECHGGKPDNADSNGKSALDYLKNNKATKEYYKELLGGYKAVKNSVELYIQEDYFAAPEPELDAEEEFILIEELTQKEKKLLVMIKTMPSSPYFGLMNTQDSNLIRKVLEGGLGQEFMLKNVIAKHYNNDINFSSDQQLPIATCFVNNVETLKAFLDVAQEQGFTNIELTIPDENGTDALLQAIDYLRLDVVEHIVSLEPEVLENKARIEALLQAAKKIHNPQRGRDNQEIIDFLKSHSQSKSSLGDSKEQLDEDFKEKQSDKDSKSASEDSTGEDSKGNLSESQSNLSDIDINFMDGESRITLNNNKQNSLSSNTEQSQTSPGAGKIKEQLEEELAELKDLGKNTSFLSLIYRYNGLMKFIKEFLKEMNTEGIIKQIINAISVDPTKVADSDEYYYDSSNMAEIKHDMAKFAPHLAGLNTDCIIN